MAEIVEGYRTSGTTAGTRVDPQSVPKDQWIDELRQDLRREMIRELAMRRIRSSGRGNQPAVPSRTERMIEGFLIGVTVTIASSWLCSLIVRSGGRER